MNKCTALYSRAARERPARARVELGRDELLVTTPDGRWLRLQLAGSRYHVRDAACAQRFVRHLRLAWAGARADFISPPDEGAIAPRAARLPAVPGDAVIVDGWVLDAIVAWMMGHGRVGGRTITELARIACIATPQFAVALGEIVARVAAEASWERPGPMRGGGDIRISLRPLEEAARHSPRAADALVSAMSHGASLKNTSLS